MNTEQQVHQTDDQILFAKLQNGEAEVWEKLLARYSKELHSYFVPLLPTTELAEDLLSETLLALVRSAQILTPKASDELTLADWVWGVAKQCARDFWYAQAQRITNLGMAGVDYAINAFWPNLSDQQRVIVFLRYAQSLPIQQIGELLGLTESTVFALLAPIRYLPADQQERLRQLVILTLAMPKKAEVRDPQLFAPVYPMLLLQKSLCQQQGLIEEVGIFTRAQQQVEQMATTSAASFPDVLVTVEVFLRVAQESGWQDPAPLLRQWIERHPKYDSSGQL